MKQWRHPQSLRIRAPAKINLFLEVVGRRSDGYHLLKTVFAKIGLADEIRISLSADKGVRLRMAGPFSEGIPSDSRNLAVRAAESFLAHFGIRQGVGIRLMKRIPPGSGLGGGSSDAASVLLGLGRLFFPEGGRSLSRVLHSLGSRLGADVCFFLTPWAAARASGAGEDLSPLVFGKNLPRLVLVYPGVESSTAQAYRRLSLNIPHRLTRSPSRGSGSTLNIPHRLTRSPSRGSGSTLNIPHRLTTLRHLGKLEKSWRQGLPLSRWHLLLFNRLEESVLPFCAPTVRVREFLRDQGLKGVLMSGSGSSVFGFCSGNSRARLVCREARKKGWSAWVTHLSGESVYGDHGDSPSPEK